MSPIVDLQRRLYELGRIRLGTSTRNERGKKIPKRLPTWRLTSRSRTALELAAELYGGTVQPWEDRGDYELVTSTDTLPIVRVPGQALSQGGERWDRPDGAEPGAAVRCIRRCDGVTEALTGSTCVCTANHDERRELAQKGKACAPVTRLSVILRDVPGVGIWRLETRGYYAAVELAGVAALLEDTTRKGVLLPARLRIDQRTGLRGEQRVNFPVPTIDVDVTVDRFAEVVGVSSPAPPALGEGDPRDEYVALPAAEPTTIEQARRELEAPKTEPARAGGRRAQEPLGAAVPPPAPDHTSAAPATPEEPTESRTEDETPQASDEDERPISRAQLTRLWAMIREKGLDDDEAALRATLLELTGKESTRAIPRSLYELVYDTLAER